MGRSKKKYAPAPTPWWLSTPFVTALALVVFALVAWLVIAIMNDDPSAPPRYVPPKDEGTIGKVELDGETQVLRMTATDYGYTPNEFQVEANKPVRLIVDGEARGCASFFVAPKLGITQRLAFGNETVFEFTPTPGRYDFSCSMGMFNGVIVAI